MLERAGMFVRRFFRAWRYHRVLRYSWHLAWVKAGSADGFR